MDTLEPSLRVLAMVVLVGWILWALPASRWRWLAVGFSTVLYFGVLWSGDPDSLCTPFSGCIVHPYQVALVVLPTALFGALATRRWRTRPGVALAALIGAFLGLLSVGRALHLSPYWGSYAGLSSPLLAAWWSRSGRISEVVVRLVTASVLLATLVWATLALGEVDWSADAKPVAAAALIYPFIAMELSSAAYQRAIHGSRPPAIEAG